MACAIVALAPAWVPLARAGGRSNPGAFWVEAPRGSAQGMQGSLADLAARLQPSIIAISVERVDGPSRDLVIGIRRGGSSRSQVFGSGFVISRDGYALTVEGLVLHARSIHVRLSDGRRVDAALVGRDSRSRLALLKLAGDGPFTPAALGDSDSTAIGEWVVALGHPDERGREEERGANSVPTLAKGIVSGRERRIENALTRVLQTDLVLVEGYGGSPLVDMNGRVIGVLDLDLRPEASLGISFAVPIREAKQVLTQLRSAGRVSHGWLGVQIQPLKPALVRSFGLESTRGALVSDVLPDTPAEQAKLRPGDVILEFGGTRIEQSSDLPGTVAGLTPGTEVSVLVLREGRRRTLQAVLGATPEDPIPAVDPPSNAGTEGDETWGFKTEVLTPALAQRYGLPAGVAGLVVTSVDPLGPADRADLVLGDVVREANGVRLHSSAELDAALATSEPLLRVQRGTTTTYRVLEREVGR